MSKYFGKFEEWSDVRKEFSNAPEQEPKNLVFAFKDYPTPTRNRFLLWYDDEGERAYSCGWDNLVVHRPNTKALEFGAENTFFFNLLKEREEEIKQNKWRPSIKKFSDIEI